MKTIKVLAVLLIPLLFTGCFDVFQSVSLHDGEIEIALRYTLQAGLLEMINGFSEEKIDINELLDEADATLPEYKGFSLGVTEINTSFHKGIEMRMAGNMDALEVNDEKQYFLPIQNGSHYSILIPSMADGDELDEMGAAFLSGSMYTLLIDLSGDLQGVRDARLVYAGNTMLSSDEDSELLVHIYGSSMLVELPMLFMFLAPDDFSIELY